MDSLTYQMNVVCLQGVISKAQKKGLQLRVLMEIRVWQVFDESHTDSIKLKWNKPSAKPHTISVKWCFPSTTRDRPTRKAHSTNRMRSGTARTKWHSRNLETMAARLACAPGKEYTSMATQSRKPGVISQGPLRFTSLWSPATVMTSRMRAVKRKLKLKLSQCQRRRIIYFKDCTRYTTQYNNVNIHQKSFSQNADFS